MTVTGPEVNATDQGENTPEMSRTPVVNAHQQGTLQGSNLI